MAAPPPDLLRTRLGEARLMWIFSPPSLEQGLAVLDALLTAAPNGPTIDAVQVRPKAPGAHRTPTEARTALAWTRAVLERTGRPEDGGPLVLVNDRVDVAAALAAEGCAGVHLGQDDMPAAEARAFLGPGPLLGLSTHDAEQLGMALDAPVDYLGFGPVFATATKGYAEGLGPDRAWIASTAATVPVFPIGGIDLVGAAELAPVGRAAVSSVLQDSADPARTAAALRALLSP